MEHSRKHNGKEIFQFFVGYAVVSVLLTFLLVGMSYKEVIKLRFNSNFYSSSTQYSQNVTNLAAEGFTKNAAGKFRDKLPVLALIMSTLLIAYVTYSAFQGVYYYLKVSKLYMNAKNYSAPLITLRYSSLSILFFVVPLLYWCFLIAVWYPIFIKLPLRHLAAANMIPFILWLLLVLAVLSLLTHLGLFMTRLASKMYKQILRG